MSQYITNSTNLFDDIDDNTPINITHSCILKKELSPEEIIKQNTLLSTQRSIGLLKESELVGISSAEELSRHREQLESTNAKLEGISKNLHESQKHINGIKSVFNGIKNYFSGNQGCGRKLSTASEVSITSETDSSFPKLFQNNLYDLKPNNHTTNIMNEDLHIDQITTTSFDDQLNKNLNGMSNHLTIVKGLAVEINKEILSQDDLIKKIAMNVEITDIKIEKQTQQMRKILGNKK